MLLCEGYMDVIALHQAGFDQCGGVPWNLIYELDMPVF